MDVDGNGWSLLSFGCDLEVLALLGVACVWNRQLLSQIYVMDHRCHCHFIELLVIIFLFLLNQENAIDACYSVSFAFVIGNENNDFVCYFACCFCFFFLFCFISFARLQCLWFATRMVMLPLLVCFGLYHNIPIQTIE